MRCVMLGSAGEWGGLFLKIEIYQGEARGLNGGGDFGKLIRDGFPVWLLLDDCSYGCFVNMLIVPWQLNC